MLRIRDGKLLKVVKSGYGQDIFTDITVLKYNSEESVFRGRIWVRGVYPPGEVTEVAKVTTVEAGEVGAAEKGCFMQFLS